MRASTKKALFLAVFVISAIFLLSGCTPRPKSEKDIIADLQSSANFLSARQLNILNHKITKRQTTPEEKIDTIYLTIEANSDPDTQYIEYSLSYIMIYELYNDGWLLESVERDWNGDWDITPHYDAPVEPIEANLSKDHYNQYELIPDEMHIFTSDGYGGTSDSLTYVAIKEYPCMTQTDKISAKYIFNEEICDWEYVEYSVDDSQKIWDLSGTWVSKPFMDGYRDYYYFKVYPEHYDGQIFSGRICVFDADSDELVYDETSNFIVEGQNKSTISIYIEDRRTRVFFYIDAGGLYRTTVPIGGSYDDRKRVYMDRR